MSRRALRKLQSGSKHSTDLEQGLSESDDTDHSPTRRKMSASNPYEVLERERTPSDNEAKEDDDLDVDLDDEQKAGADKTQMTDSLKRKKKKKKRKAKEAKEEDIEAVVKEVKDMLGETDDAIPLASSSSASVPPVRHLFSIDYRHLQPDNEMRRIFGSKVVQADIGKRKVRGRGHTKSTKLVTPRHNWPHVGKAGITMTLVESKDGLQYFKFEHSNSYQQIQFQFLDAVESLIPDNIVSVINIHPYHIDALLQLSDIMRLGEDTQMAAELIERALYCFENNFHPLFNLAQGNCRLDYKYSENRSFYIALFKHLNYVSQKGCYRTALEFCKVLLSLDPKGDPLGVSLMIDYFALKSGEHAYLIQLFNEWERNLSQLPNFAFSVALAKYHSWRANSDDTELKNEADNSLQKAIMAFPAILMIMLDKCNVQPDARVSSHSFFSESCEKSHPQALMTLLRLYVGRCHHLWKEPEVVLWLETNVKLTLDLVDKNDPDVSLFVEKRQARYQGMPKNIYRHILMSEIKDATASLPAEMARSSMMSFDPLPPADNVSSYSRPPRQQNDSERAQNVLEVLFRSLFPNYAIEEAQRQDLQIARQRAEEPQFEMEAVLPDVAAVGNNNDGGAVPPEAPAAEGGASGGDMQDFRRSVTSLLDAMRDLLTNIHFPEVEQEGVEADDSDVDPDN